MGKRKSLWLEGEYTIRKHLNEIQENADWGSSEQLLCIIAQLLLEIIKRMR